MSVDSAVNSPLLRAEHVGYVWHTMRDSRRAITDVSAEFSAGEPRFICGPSGSGKSTLGLVLSGLLKPFEGVVTLDGAGIDSQRQRVAHVFQFPESLFFADTVAEELVDVAGTVAANRTPAVFETLGIAYEDIQRKNPHLLSEGFARLTAIALQMAREPDLLILDEPTIGLDGKHQERVISALRERLNQLRITIVITHDLDLLEALGGSTLVLADGQWAWNGSTMHLLEQPSLLKQFRLSL